MSNGPWPPATLSEQERRVEGDRRARIYKATTTINDVTKLPAQGAHYAVLVNDSYSSHDGYSEREGGGYSTTNVTTYIHFGDEEALEAWILANHLNKTFVVLRSEVVNVGLRTVINLKGGK